MNRTLMRVGVAWGTLGLGRVVKSTGYVYNCSALDLRNRLMPAVQNGLKNGCKVVTVTAACLAISAPAYAEGSWTSTLSNVKVGYGSRTWTDRNLDNGSIYGNVKVNY